MEKFEELCNGYIQTAIEYCNNNLYQYKREKVNIDFKIRNSMNIGGSSTYNGENYSIAINYGVFKKIEIIYGILLHKNNEQFYKTVAVEKEFDDEKAGFYMHLLMEISCKIIIFHELGHIFNGHLKYKYYEIDNNDSLEMNMLPEESNSLPPLFSQALELNADAFAATFVLGQITFDETISKYNKQCPELIKSKSHVYTMFFIASGILFSEMGLANSRKNAALHELKYLPLRTRLDMFLRNSLTSYFALNKEVSADRELLNMDFLREVKSNIESYVNLLHVAEGLPESEFNNSNNSEELDEVHIQHADELLKYWTNEVSPKLFTYTYFALPD